MNRPLLKRIVLAGLIAALVAAYFIFDLGRYLSLDFLKASRDLFAAYYAENTALTITLYHADVHCGHRALPARCGHHDTCRRGDVRVR